MSSRPAPSFSATGSEAMAPPPLLPPVCCCAAFFEALLCPDPIGVVIRYARANIKVQPAAAAPRRARESSEIQVSMVMHFGRAGGRRNAPGSAKPSRRGLSNTMYLMWNRTAPISDRRYILASLVVAARAALYDRGKAGSTDRRCSLSSLATRNSLDITSMGSLSSQVRFQDDGSRIRPDRWAEQAATVPFRCTAGVRPPGPGAGYQAQQPGVRPGQAPGQPRPAAGEGSTALYRRRASTPCHMRLQFS